MYFLLSGEGPTDMGNCIAGNEPCEGKDFAMGPMAVMVDQLAEQKLDYSPLGAQAVGFVSEGYLSRRLKNDPNRKRKSLGLPGRKTKKETKYFYNNALTLALTAKEKREELGMEVIAVLFRDSDGTASTTRGLWETKVESILNGFDSAEFDKGVPMVPKPKSEAWLLCALREDYQNCQPLENASGNDRSPNNLKKQLADHLTYSPNREQLSVMVDKHTVDVSQIDMPSFNAFKTRLLSVI